MRQDDQAPQQYALRIQPQAERDINAHTVRMVELAGEEVARAWYHGLFESAATLAENPKRSPIVSEADRFRQEVRQFLFRRTQDGPAWRILFTVNEGAEDAPTVNIIHIRHGAQRPITRAEARRMEQSE